MTRGPRDVELAADHVRHRRRLVVLVAAVAIATLGIVLRVHQPIIVIAVAAALIQSVVGAGRVLHVDIGRDAGQRHENRRNAHVAAKELAETL